MSTAIGMFSNICNDALILDFGCGKQYLKKYLETEKYSVVGYDVVSQLSDIEDYAILKPDVILCNHVLEHLGIAALRETLDNFEKMKPRFIVTGIPTENFISRFCAYIGKPHGYFEHKTRIKAIHDELSRRFVLAERRNVMNLTIVSKWK